MIPLAKITPEQLAGYRKTSGSPDGLDYQFGGPSGLFIFKGDLRVTDGQILLTAFLAAHACEHEPDEMTEPISDIRRAICEAPWELADSARERLDGTWDTFRIELLSEPTRDGTVATHLLLSCGNSARLREEYFSFDFELRSEGARSESVAKTPSGYYPVRTGRSPEEVEELGVVELADRIRGMPIVAFTGAGISLVSGIPSFTGPGGLQEEFPIDSYRFPGAVADWMIQRPRQTATILSTFQTRFMTAEPNGAHTSLAELEKHGILKHIITGTIDHLHERAGSENVHVNEAKYFKGSEEGWSWIRSGKVALATGVSMDARNGLLDYARDQGLQLVAIGPDRPTFLHSGDWFVQGPAEVLLPQLADLLIAPART